MALPKKVHYGSGKKAILILFVLAAICAVVWIVGLGLLGGIGSCSKYTDSCQMGLLAFAAGFVGVLVGFLASIPSPMSHGDQRVELEGGVVSETGRWISSAIAGGSLTAAALKGKEFLAWLAESLSQSEGVIFLTIVLYAVLGFLIMYFARRVVLNLVLADARRQLEAKVRDIRIVNELGPATLSETPGKIPAVIHDAIDRLTSDRTARPLQEYEGLLAQGIALKLKGDLEGAIDLLERASRANPTDYRAMAALASAYFDMGNTREAYAQLCRTEKLKAQDLDPGYLKLNAQISYGAGEYGKAIHYYLQYLKENPNDADARFRLAAAYARIGAVKDDNEAYENAMTALDAALKRGDVSLKSRAFEEMQEDGAFKCLADNDRFKEIIETPGSSA